MFTQVDYIMIYVSDMKRSVEFYRDKLGLPLKFESPEWTEFKTGTTTLALHGGGQPSAGNIDKIKEPTAGTCTIGFTVKEIEKTYEELRSKGVKFITPPTLRKEEGITLAICQDPDGLAISFAQAL